ncbi:tyrosine-type recombinase/integrase [Mycobacterium simiae]|uniref:Tyrosine-type recombinase/integrase n=1 Tax=Mycobacterium simiae TaxID=1784 RepID=A0A5B1BCY4_MYCSI|nr:tyrosine-type recombinase/integrase [Mycobacterium simiae]KAA1246256.1 tyrosine-type recombinase/integrase [Mycobacterium simiae]
MTFGALSRRCSDLALTLMYKAFHFSTDAGGYWSVIDDRDYVVVELADDFLQFMRFARGRAESTTRKYAESIALYYNFCADRSANWADPDITAFQMWLRIAPSPRHPHASRRVWAGPGHHPARNNNRINLITYAVCEMFKFAAAEGVSVESKLNRLFEMAPVQNYGPSDRRHQLSTTVILRRRHRLQPQRGSSRRDAPVAVVKNLLAECLNARDALLVAMLATTGLRRGEALGLRLSDLHFLPDSTSLGCQIDGPHLHVVPRVNSNQAQVKNQKPRALPVTAALITMYERYRMDRDACRQARESDYVFVNLYRAPLGEPMKLHAANDLLSRLSRRTGHKVSPHMLRHTFGTGAAQTESLDVVAELLGHANLQTTQTYLHPDMTRQRTAIEAGALSQHLETPTTS